MAFRFGAASSIFVFLGTCVLQAAARTFLAPDPNGFGANFPKEGGLLAELERVVGESRLTTVTGHAELLKESMRPTFFALPRDSRDRLPADAVNYLLHRLFVDRHGWYVHGIHSVTGAWNSSSPAEVFKQHDSRVHGLFEKRLESQGFSLDEVALLAATLENFVHQESVGRLHAAFRHVGLTNATSNASEAQVLKAIDAYMIIYVFGWDHTRVDGTKLQKKLDGGIVKNYPAWGESQKWVREVRAEVLATLAPSESPTSFVTTSRVVEEIAERYGRWQDRECQVLKTSLINVEHGVSGRVRLDAFYLLAMEDDSLFPESKDYMRQLGVLDESEPTRPSLLISNYVNSPATCIGGSKFYSVCCMNECEVLLGTLERAIAAPSASPARMVELVSSMPSSTVQAPRSLPNTLVDRLEGIASQHGGKVPLHGRLFAQWLHHAYPRECPYPQLSGTVESITAGEFKKRNGVSSQATTEAMQQHIEEMQLLDGGGGPAKSTGEDGSALELHWCTEEELFVTHPVQSEPHGVKHYLTGLMLAAAGVSMVLYMARTFTAAVETAESRSLKHYV